MNVPSLADFLGTRLAPANGGTNHTNPVPSEPDRLASPNRRFKRSGQLAGQLATQVTSVGQLASQLEILTGQPVNSVLRRFGQLASQLDNQLASQLDKKLVKDWACRSRRMQIAQQTPERRKEIAQLGVAARRRKREGS